LWIKLAGEIKKIKLEGENWLEKQKECEDQRCSLELGCKWSEGHKLEPVGYGIHKLLIQCIVQGELVGTDDLIDIMIEKFEDEIQSVDIADFSKI
jgi:translation elongation factor EF-1beta